MFMRILVSLLFFLLSNAIWAQQDTVYVLGGTIDAMSFQPIEDVQVVALNARGDTVAVDRSVDQYKLYGIDNNGEVLVTFRLELPRHGDYRLIASKVGYEELVYPLHVPEKLNGKRVTLYEMGNLKLEKTLSLPEAVVTASKVMMVLKGDTLVYNADAFQLATGSLLDRLIEQLPGVSLNPGGQIMVNGEFVTSLLVDGKDFFSGDARVALRNLPAYSVSKVQVYRREPEDAYLEVRDTLERKQYPLVMDVRLKKEFHERWMGNVDAGVGTHDRYSLRGFTMRTDDVSRATAFARWNNIGDTRSADQHNAFSIDQLATNPLTDKSGGVDLYWNNRKTKAYITGTITGGEQEETVESKSTLRHLLATTDSYSSLGQSRANTLRRRMESYLRLAVPLRRVFIESALWLKYHHESANAFSQTTLLLPTSTESLSHDKLWRDPMYASSVINDLREDRSQKGHNFDLLWGGKAKFVSPFTGNTITLHADASIGESKTDQTTFADRYTSNVATWLKSQRTAHLPTHNYSLEGGVDYEIKWRNISWLLTYKFTHDYHEKERTIAAYEVQGNHQWPTNAVLQQDIDNSYRSHEQTNRHSLTSLWRTSFSRHLLSLKLPLVIEATEGFDTRAASVRQHYVLCSPQVSWLSPWGVSMYYQLSGNAPSVAQRFSFTDTFDPQLRYVGNPNLKASHTHQIAIDYNGKAKYRAQTWYANGKWNLEHNKVVQASALSPSDGVYTFMPRQVSGDYLLALEAGYNRQLDAMGHWALSVSSDARWQREQFFASLLSAPLSGAEDIGNVRSLNIKSSARLMWRTTSLQLALKVAVNHLAVQSSSLTSHWKGTDQTIGLLSSYQLAKDWQLSVDYTLFLRHGYTQDIVRKYSHLCNAALNRSLGKHWSIRLEAYDLLHQIHNIERQFTATTWSERWQQTLPPYLMLNVMWQF